MSGLSHANLFTDYRRLYVALLISCLLHGVLFFLPYFGASSALSRAAARRALESRPAPMLDVRLGQASGSAVAPARNAADEETSAAPRRAYGGEQLPLPAPTYYTTDQLTKPPQPTSQPDLDPPHIARAISGTVVLKLWINELGGVNAVEVENSDLPPKISRTAAEAFGKVRFVPGEIDGRRVPALMRIEVRYGRARRQPP